MTIGDDTERLWDARNAMREIARASYGEAVRKPRPARGLAAVLSGLGLVIVLIGLVVAELFLVIASVSFGVLLLIVAIAAALIDRRDRRALAAYQPLEGWPSDGARDGIDPAIDFLCAYWPGRAPNLLLWHQGGAENRRTWLEGDRLVVVIDAARPSDTMHPPTVVALWAATQAVDIHRYATPDVLGVLAPPAAAPPPRPSTTPPTATPEQVAEAFLTAICGDDPATALLHTDPFIFALAVAEPDPIIGVKPPSDWRPKRVSRINDDTREHDFSATIDGRKRRVSVHLTLRAGRWLVRGLSYDNDHVFGYPVPRD